MKGGEEEKKRIWELQLGEQCWPSRKGLTAFVWGWEDLLLRSEQFREGGWEEHRKDNCWQHEPAGILSHSSCTLDVGWQTRTRECMVGAANHSDYLIAGTIATMLIPRISIIVILFMFLVPGVRIPEDFPLDQIEIIPMSCSHHLRNQVSQNATSGSATAVNPAWCPQILNCRSSDLRTLRHVNIYQVRSQSWKHLNDTEELRIHQIGNISSAWRSSTVASKIRALLERVDAFCRVHETNSQAAFPTSKTKAANNICIRCTILPPYPSPGILQFGNKHIPFGCLICTGILLLGWRTTRDRDGRSPDGNSADSDFHVMPRLWGSVPFPLSQFLIKWGSQL